MKFFVQKQNAPSKQTESDIKTLLKLARQYIDDNNIKKGQQCCKKVLRKDSQNYMAFVLLGKSYGKTNEAPSSYEKAIELKPENSLAWQGLAHYYEGKEEESAKTKLLNIYDKILSLNINDDFAERILKKLAEVGSLLQNNTTITSFIQYIRLQENEQLIGTAKKQVLKLLRANVSCRNEDVPEVIQILKNLDNEDMSADNSELIILGKLILRNKSFAYAVGEIISLEFFPISLTLKTWLCKLLCETFIKEDEYLHGFNIDIYINDCVAGVEDTTYGSILIGIMYYRRNMFEEAYWQCMSKTKEHMDNIEDIEALFLLKCSKRTPNLLRTKNLCNYFLRKENLNYPAFLLTINSVLLTCYLQEKDFCRSIHYLKKIPVDQIDSLVLTELGNMYLEVNIVKDLTCDMLKATDYYDLFRALACIKRKKFTEATEIFLQYDKHPIKYYFLGLSYWSSNQNDESLECFKKAAELMPGHPKVNYCLGVHYYRIKDDVEESRKYFEMSYAVSKTNKKVVKMLSTIYTRLGLVDLEFNLMQSAFDVPETKEFWVCVKLGQICYKRGIVTEALRYLQAAINLQPQDIIAQEMIGDIYYNNKDYDNAFNAYNKVVELSRDSTVFFKCFGRLGCIYSEKMLYHRAIYVFDCVLDKDPSNVQALKGVTENRITIALKSVANDLFQDARDQMQFAFNRITTAMAIGIKDLVYWLLYGDVLIFMTRLPNQNSYVILQTPEGEIRKEKIDMYKMAIEGYSNVVKFRDPCALFKCALAYFEYYYETRNIAFCKTAYNLAVIYMKVNPNVWPNWDLLGKVCYNLNKGETAYYCFTKVLGLCKDYEFKIWCDLGLFYLKLDKHQLATYSHVIERIDFSSLAPSWVREKVSGAACNHGHSEISIDAPFGREEVHKLQFAEWIRNFRPTSAQPSVPVFESPIESFKIMPIASEIIEWYLSFEEESVWSCCSLGHLQEGKRLFVPALRYYDQAFGIAAKDQKNEVLSHKGRVLIKMRKYEEAISVFSEIRDKNLQDTCALASAYYKIKKYEESYALYEKALNDLCENDEQRVDILITMSNVAYRLKGLCEGAMLILRAIKIKCGENKDFKLPFMKATLKKIDIQLAAHVMSHFLRKYIDKGTWNNQGLTYLKGINKYAKITRACIKKVIRANAEPRRNGRLYALISVAEFYAGNRRKAMTYASRALKLCPFQPELWAVFTLCLYSDKTWHRNASFLRIVRSTIRKLISVSRDMEKWLNQVEEKTNRPPKNYKFTYVCKTVAP